MLKCEAETLEGEMVKFEIWEMSHTIPADDVAYIHTSWGGAYPVKLSSIRQATQQSFAPETAIASPTDEALREFQSSNQSGIA
jgi:hypothetical protein